MEIMLMTIAVFLLRGVQCTTIWGCDFDVNSNSPCGMTQSTQDTVGFDWLPINFGTPSANTGPSGDHTSGQGYYMYIEASDHLPDSYSDLDTPTLVESSRYCVTFWYHMYGQHIGSLALLALTASGDTQEVWLRNREGSAGVDAWQEGSVTLEGSTQKVRFRAVRGGATDGQPFGDIAIDDIIIDNKACGAPDVTTEKPTTEKPTTEKDSNELFRCEFSADSLCDLVQTDETDDFDWQLHRGYTLSEPTGPRVDHTTGTDQGYYLYAEASQRETNDRAIISYSATSLGQTACLTFWYHMFGQHVGQLKVTEVKDGGEVNVMWEESGDQGDQWYASHVTMTEDTSKVQFTAIRGGDTSNDQQGDIALDDLTVRRGPCSLYTTTEATTTTSTTSRDTTQTVISEELWGLEDTYWIVILSVAGAVILVLLMVIVCQACALSNTKHSSSAQITRRTGGDFDNFDGYTKYSGGGVNGTGATPSSSSAPGYINAYENGAYNP